MLTNLKQILESQPVEASAPCRIDMGGTLDIRTFYYPLGYLSPCTFNIALNLRTHVRLMPWKEGWVKISSRGFDSAEYSIDTVPFRHPLGLMFAIAAYFRAAGVHIAIESTSPVRSALGGSSSAAIALVTAFSECLERSRQQPLTRDQIAMRAYSIEESVAGVPCGIQDHLAATYGGVNAWYWPTLTFPEPFRMEPVISEFEAPALEKHLLVAYCGVPHESRDINGKWVRQFLEGSFRDAWRDIVTYTHTFIRALGKHDFYGAAEAMNAEVSVRKKMTPDVLDDLGDDLVRSAVNHQCGARFTGAGGGGCLWALGAANDIDRLRPVWDQILAPRPEAELLTVNVNTTGVQVEG